VQRHAGPVVDTATRNVVRDPGRSAATATALMLAVGLIVTLQVGASSVRTSVLDKVGAIVGVVFGVFLGFVGARALITQIGVDSSYAVPLRFDVDWPRTLILLAVLVAAAAIASLLPGRRATSASPVEAPAEV